MSLTALYREFFKSEKIGGIVLLTMTVLSLFLANSNWSSSYANLWNFELAGHSVVHWINDGLMTLFFLLIGMELEREIYKGELSNLRNAFFPVIAAVGGMVIPALFFSIFNFGTETSAGAGIPMATDIAFAVGVLSLLGSRVPASLKIFLTAFAVIDDLGSILIIAVFYTNELSFTNIIIALAIFAVLLILNRLKIHNMIPYLIGGAIMWYFMSGSGIHPTITGVLLAFAIPFEDGSEKSPSYILQHVLHKPVAYIILPLFALANTAIIIESNLVSSLGQNLSIGILYGLVIGKPLGICLFSFFGVIYGFCTLPADLKWVNIIGAGFLGGIGFTMSIFISLLAFDMPEMVNVSKLSVLAGSFLAGIIGLLILKMTLKTPIDEKNNLPAIHN